MKKLLALAIFCICSAAQINPAFSAMLQACDKDNPCPKEYSCEMPLWGKKAKRSFCFKKCQSNKDCGSMPKGICPTAWECQDGLCRCPKTQAKSCKINSDCPKGMHCTDVGIGEKFCHPKK